MLLKMLIINIIINIIITKFYCKKLLNSTSNLTFYYFKFSINCYKVRYNIILFRFRNTASAKLFDEYEI